MYHRARSWISNCLTSHRHDRSDHDSSFRPSRLLHIKEKPGSYQVQLSSTSRYQVGPVVPFVALSYCWGGDQQHKTTKQSIKSGADVVYHELPKTIQDAIKATVKLVYEYLWVDSLCIAQDDKEEIACEIAQMPLIYSNAVVTIAASVSKSASSGFLHDRKDLVESGKIQVLWPDGSSEVMRLVLSKRDEFHPEPLDKRAWAMQERILSTRILDYRSRQLQFTCSFSNNHTGYNDGWIQAPAATRNH